MSCIKKRELTLSRARLPRDVASRGDQQRSTEAISRSRSNVQTIPVSLDDAHSFMDNQSCVYPTCQYQGPMQDDLYEHFRTAHPCAFCGKAFFGYEEFQKHHAYSSGHPKWHCAVVGCSSKFSRRDVLVRHHKTQHNADKSKFCCEQCKTIDRVKVFKRKDHLTQHLREFHNQEVVVRDYSECCSCPHYGCEYFRVGAYDYSGATNEMFQQEKSGCEHAFSLGHHFQRHMRQVHKESPFHCQAPGCDRRGAKGYFSQNGLEKHQLKEHADLAEHLKKVNKLWRAELPAYFQHLVDWKD